MKRFVLSSVFVSLTGSLFATSFNAQLTLHEDVKLKHVRRHNISAGSYSIGIELPEFSNELTLRIENTSYHFQTAEGDFTTDSGSYMLPGKRNPHVKLAVDLTTDIQISDSYTVSKSCVYSSYRTYPWNYPYPHYITHYIYGSRLVTQKDTTRTRHHSMRLVESKNMEHTLGDIVGEYSQVSSTILEMTDCEL